MNEIKPSCFRRKRNDFSISSSPIYVMLAFNIIIVYDILKPITRIINLKFFENSKSVCMFERNRVTIECHFNSDFKIIHRTTYNYVQNLLFF